tara:strand:- start:145 stop:339 length:195 start_codon:yes stop_codon:yes gene_type:complete
MAKVIIGKRIQTTKARREWNMANKHRRAIASDMLGYSETNKDKLWSKLPQGLKKGLINSGFRHK